MKRKFFIAFCILIMTLFSGCGGKNENNEPIIIDTNLNVTNYYFASDKNSASLLNEFCSGYNDRMADGMAISLSATYFNEKMMTAYLRSDFPNDGSLNKTEETKIVKLGFIEGIFAGKSGDEIKGYFHSIAVSSAMKAFRGIDIEKRLYSRRPHQILCKTE